MRYVTNVQNVKEYILEITFDNGCVREIDFMEHLERKGVFLPLFDVEYFKTVHVDTTGTTICRENGADFCPNVLYTMGRVKEPCILVSDL